MNKNFIGIILKRVISSVITLFILVSFLFVLIRISPGNPAQKYLSPNFSPQLIELVNKKFSTDKSLIEQYANFVKNIFTGEFGVSYNYHLPVLKVLWQFLSFTILFSLVSFLVQILAGFLLAVFVSRSEKLWLDKLVTNFSLALYSTPSFVLGVILILVFSVKLGFFPISGLKSLDFSSLNFFEKIGNLFAHLLLPVVTLSASGAPVFYKYIKDNLSEVKNETYIFQLRASGYKESDILLKHIIPNSIRPLISIAGIELGILLGGALITEVIFGLPGMGRLTIDSILSRDYPMIIACAFSAGVLMIISNFIADIVKSRLDPNTMKEQLN